MSEGAIERFVEAIADNSESIQDVAVVRDIGVPQALGAMSFSDIAGESSSIGDFIVSCEQIRTK
jgi:hypothetical protein